MDKSLIGSQFLIYYRRHFINRHFTPFLRFVDDGQKSKDR